MSKVIKRREKDAILQSLRAGVVPKIGLQHIQVGRKKELEAMISDFDRVENDGSFVRFTIGKYGSGKSFFLNLSRAIALSRNMVVINADITTERRLNGTNGQARSLYAELMRNLATRSKTEGGALSNIVEKWVSDVEYKVKQGGGAQGDVKGEIQKKLKPLQELVSGYDFADVLEKYYEGYVSMNDRLQDAALRWLRAEYTTKTEAREDLGVRNIIDDKNIYDYLKLFGSFTGMAGYSGLVVNIDEMGVFSHRLNNASARNNNYEMLLRIVNDCLQGSVSRLGFVFAGTEEFLSDRRRGVASYEALWARLSLGSFVKDGLKDYSGPVIQLDNLTLEDLYVLLMNIREVYFSEQGNSAIFPAEAIEAFISWCSYKMGAEFFLKPREVVREFVGVLSVLEQNPEKNWQDLLGNYSRAFEDDVQDDTPVDDEDELSSFKL